MGGIPALALVLAGGLLVLQAGAQEPDSGAAGGDTDPFSRGGICAFAEHLDAEGDAAAAAAEYARCAYLTEAADSSLHPEWRRLRIRALLRAGDLEPAYHDFRSWVEADTAGPDSVRGAARFPWETAYALGRSLVGADRDSLALAALADVPAGGKGLDEARVRMIEAAACLRLGDADAARAALDKAGQAGGSEARASIALLDTLARKSRAGFGGNRWLAGFLSAAVPGLGKAYAGRPLDGLASFLVLAFFGWQAWDGYAHDGPASVKGAVFAASGTGLYAGNVYGSMRAVDAEKEKRRKAFGEQVKFVATFRLP